VDDAIQDGVAKGGLANNFMPGGKGELAGDQQGAAAMTMPTISIRWRRGWWRGDPVPAIEGAIAGNRYAFAATSNRRDPLSSGMRLHADQHQITREGRQK
jgi:hypothetical protein